MSLIIVEWHDGGVSIVNKNWLTPLRKEVFWPPIKDQNQFNKELKKSDSNIEDTWTLLKVKKCLYETNDFEKAVKKWKEAEDTSHLDSDSSSELLNRPRKRIAKKRLLSFSSGLEDDEEPCTSKSIKRSALSSKLKRPPIIDPNIFSNSPSEDFEELDVTITSLQLPQTSSNSTPSTSKESLSFTSSSIATTAQGNIADNSTPQTYVPNITPYQKKVISLLTHIKEQNGEILRKLNENNLLVCGGSMPELPVIVPVKSVEDLRTLESFLKDSGYSELISYLSSLGGRDTTTRTNKILKALLTDEVASFYNFFGSRDVKLPFNSLVLKTVVVQAVKLSIPGTTEKNIEDVIKTWLKHAPQRLKRRCSFNSA